MFARFFVDRPVLATVISLVIIIVGGVALLRLPIAQYPEVTPPTIQVTATYPGADAKTVADTVATPIELEVNGVERMLYMSSRCTNDGQMTLDVTFELGTNLDTAQVLVQNRVAIAEAKLPEEVKRIGVTTKKKSPSILLCVNLISPGGKYDQLYLSNFATLNVKDGLARVKGVGDVQLLGARDYSMRVWLDPRKLAALDMTATDVVRAIREQNVQVAAGRIGQPPVPEGAVVPFQLPIKAQGRLSAEEQFEKIIVKSGAEGEVVYLRDVVMETKLDEKGHAQEKGVELGAKNYEVGSNLDGKPSVTLAAFQLPGSNALDTAKAIRAKMEELKNRFPEGLEYKIVYDTTVFIDESVHEVYKTLFEAFILVFIVVLVFLQDWRATLLPMIDVPVSLIGTFAVMAMLGFSLNNLTLFGLVLAIGIVVDDAIVVVENVERWMAKGLPPREATIKAMEEITGPVIAITLVLSSVFIPTAFLAGISGQFYKQFALTIAASTIISAINAMTMAPARAVVLIKPHGGAHGGHGERQALPPFGIALIVGFIVYSFVVPPLLSAFGASEPGASAALVWAIRLSVLAAGTAAGYFLLVRPVNYVLNRFLAGFNRFFEAMSAGYGRIVKSLLRVSVVALVIYVGLLGLTGLGFQVVPKGFIPEQDKGYLVVNAQLPDGASLGRSEEVVARMSEAARATPGVAHTIDLPGYSPLLSVNLSNVGGMFVVLAPFEERKGHPELSAPAIVKALRQKFGAILEAQVAVFGAPPVEGLGTTGGFKLQIQDRRGAGLVALDGAVKNLAEQGRADPGLAALFTTFSVGQPQLFVEIDRVKAKAQHVSLDEVHMALQAYLGSFYVNDFFFQERNWQVNIQADPRFRMREEDIGRLEVRNAEGERVPLGTLVLGKSTSGPPVVNRYNLYPSAELNGAPVPGTSSREAITIMDGVSDEQLPSTMGYEWTELSLQELLAEKDILAKLVFPLSVLFVFMVLAAQYESWSLPFAILLIVPMCLLSSIGGVYLVGLDNNIFVQIGFVVLIGLAAKNAILVVEFSKQLQDQGKSRADAVIEASRTRLRPILMTSFAFILGVVPLVLAKGAGAEMRFALGVAVVSGMIGVTFFGLVFTPVFYNVIRWFIERKEPPAKPPAGTSAAEGSTAPTGAAHGALLIAAASALALAGSGCGLIDWAKNGLKVGPEYVKPEEAVASRFIDDKDPRVKAGAEPEPEYWQVFKDPVLDALIEDAYRQNLSLRAAGFRILAAQARRGIAIGNVFPQIQEAAGSYTHNKLSKETAVPPPPDLWFSNVDVGFNVAWELDLWGRFRRAIEATDAELEASVHDYDQVLTLLLAEVATQYVRYRTFEERLFFSRRNVEAQTSAYELADSKFKAGASTERDVSQAKQILEQTRSRIPGLEAGMRRAANALCVLLGITAQDLSARLGPDGRVPVAPREVAVGIPADLVRRRPDVRRAERLVAAQSALIGVAESDLYPHFSLFGSLGVQADYVSRLFFHPESLFYTVGPGFRWDILNYGRISNNIRVQDARFEELAFIYQETVLQAGREAEDAIISFLKAGEETDFLAASVEAARRTVEITVDQYEAGAVDFTPVFLFEAALAEQEDQLAASRGDVALSLIDTYRALGGGWEIRLAPARASAE